ncbi:terpenoid synthase [Aspergillus heteromorphus CBS 117.55]|uniref:Terpenoid synthase n=1 Tax=Aspergillus heteromorphus CBS 117.55 TaxID=1448321 RepID=A0A317VEV0_9EURO|nr:terpenoid synthase [Aspergillus heteromorphus CBS 117.55]PWY72886.1 terpenoid synthase [Aspergillus heteromorphus CBS 117.55]
MSTSDLTPVSKAEFSEILNIWVKQYNINPSDQPDITPIIDSITADCIAQLGPEVGPKYAVNGAMLAVTFYSTHPTSLQRILGLYTAGFLSLDDLAPDLHSDIELFGKRIQTGQPQPRGPLEILRKSLAEMEPHYSDFTMGMIYATTFEAMLSMVMESSGRAFSADQVSANFTQFFRWLLGFGKPYGYFLLAPVLYDAPIRDVEVVLFGLMPDLSEMGVVLNDDLSFYKESVVGDERSNYIYKEARSRGISLYRELVETTQRMIATYDDMRRKVGEIPQLQVVTDAWMKGMVQFHFAASRYRLHEVEIS